VSRFSTKFDDTDYETEDESEPVFDDNWVRDVLFRVKSGKEATVYCCAAGPKVSAEFVALKIYKDLSQRNFKNDAVYQEGRFRMARESRAARAIRTKTAKGREFQFGAWIGHEFETLRALHAAGADVPVPYRFSEKALAMEFVGDGGAPAQGLHALHLSTFEAERVCNTVLSNVDLMLSHNVVHADLSAYNILYGPAGLKIIDFPQAIDPRFNNSARDLLLRDVQNVCGYFNRYGSRYWDAERITTDLWGRFRRSEF
jgi:RIO kinase 1